jgi:hypothetical protein
MESIVFLADFLVQMLDPSLYVKFKVFKGIDGP